MLPVAWRLAVLATMGTWRASPDQKSRIPALVHARQHHRALEVLGILELHIGADGIRKAAGEKASLLQWCQVARVRQAGQECLGVLLDRSAERQAR